ncbi:uncharacterized protein LOC132752482 isoform X2 [Ruditapes philippinarum]|nr:uncharacterized protein LOC132752482 isoform X2 [Ruditapes philippinarum]
MTLLRAKADVRIRNEKGKTPQQEAMEGGNRAIAEDIVEYANVQRRVGQRQAVTPDELIPRNPPEIRISSVARRKSECAISYHVTEAQPVENTEEDPDYENSERRPSVPGPLPTFRHNSLDIPPPRPPIARSTSFSGKGDSALNNVPDNNSENQKKLYMASRTNSVGSIPYDTSRIFLNDVNVKFYTENTNTHCQQDTSLSQPTSDFTDTTSAYSSDTSWRTPSMTSSEPTESSDFTLNHSRTVPEVPPRARSQNRPNRLSLGSSREIFDGSPDAELKKQLVESYKQTEKLGKENEVLNFKCSTLLGRLSDTEHLMKERIKECENLKELLNVKSQDIKEKEDIIQALKNNPVTVSKVVANNGFKHFTERLNKTLSDDTLDEFQEILRESLQNFALSPCSTVEQLDAPHREWVPGVDYVIIGRQHLEDMVDPNQVYMPKQLSFLIKHLKTGRKLVLKMLLRFRKRGEADSDIAWRSTDEFDIMDRLSDQPNVTKVLHSYESSTERFKKFIAVPHGHPYNADELCSRTTFLVTEQMITLTTFIKTFATESNSSLMSTFLLHSFYQLLSVLCVLEELGIEHNNITDTTIFVNEELRPMLGGFEMASFNNEVKDIQTEGPPDYENVEHLARGSHMHRLPRNFARRNNDLFALGKYFDNILLDDGIQTSDDATWPQYTSGCMASLPPSVWQVLNGIITKFQNYSSRDCLHRIGFSLFGPRRGEVCNVFQTKTYMQQQMLKLLALNPVTQRNAAQPEQLTVSDAVDRNKYEIETHFLCNITQKQLWDMYKMLEKDDLLLDQ